MYHDKNKQVLTKSLGKKYQGHPPPLAFFLFILCLLVIPFNQSFSQVQESTPKELFLEDTFESKPVEKKIWLIGDKKNKVHEILGHSYKKIRVGYWSTEETPKTRVWILQEIGKEKDIDVAIAIQNNKIQKLRILAFRESRGWEVKLPFFTEQFDQNHLTTDFKLTNQVNNISGATLSWRAVTKLARLALYLDSQVK